MKTEISASAESITSTVAESTKQWDTVDSNGNAVSIKQSGYGFDGSISGGDSYVYSDSMVEDDIYLDQKLGYGWACKGTKVINGRRAALFGYRPRYVFKLITSNLSSDIKQTASSIESTVAESQSKWDITNFPVPNATIKSGYGVPKVSMTGYNGYLDVSTGLEYYWGDDGTGTGNKKWAIVGKATEIKSDLETKIEQTSESITLEVNRATKKEEDLQSSIDMHADEIVLKVDANGRIVEVALTGNPKDGTEFTVDADNIYLTASDIIDIIANNSINLTSKHISIDSTNFSVDEDGNMKCNGGEFSGTVKASDIYAKNGLKMYVDTWKPDNPPDYKTILAIYKYSANLRDVFQLQVGLNLDEVALPSTVTLGFANKFVIGSMYSNNSNVANITNISYYYGLTTPAIGFESLGNQNFFIAVNASDTKLKKNMIETEMTSLDKIKRIEFIQFDWKDSGIHVPLGVSANQLEEIIPQAVYNVKQPEESEYDSLKNIDTTSLLNYSLKAIQELSEVVDSQREEIDTLKQKLATLTERMDRHEQGLQ